MQEALNLQVGDIDGGRGLVHVHVHRGKGAKDRDVPLSSSTLDMLRQYSTVHRVAISNKRLVACGMLPKT